MATDNYIRFTSTNPRFDFSFLYPASWQASETEEKGYSQVFVRGPRNKANTYSTTLVVNILPAGEMTLEEKVADYLTKAAKARAFKIVSTVKGFLAGAEAAELLMSYKTSLPIYSVKATDTTIIERRIIVRYANRFYELEYNAVEEDYDASLQAFENAARTFAFRDGEAQGFRSIVVPVTVPAPALAVAEKRETYKPEG